jgi:WD40 repeat protein
VVIVSKGGYFTGARAAYPSASKTTTMLLTLQQAKQTRTISAASGGQVAVGAATVDLPANGYVDAQGNAYTGTVSVAARYLDPTADNFYDSFSGDMAALRADGSSTELISYGVLRVKLTGSQGQPLNLRQGSTATLTYPAAGATDASIPLWHFDETRGIWVEEGTATRVGGNYVGTVSHFTDWNLDVPSPRVAFIEGRVTCGEDIPLGGIAVDIGQVTAVTDQDGMYRRRVPADITFDVEVKGSRNEGISASAVTVGPIAENQTLVKDIVVSPCPTLLQAQIVDCDSIPVGGVLEIVTDEGVKLHTSTTGKFLVSVPAGKSLLLEGYSMKGLAFTSKTVQPVVANTPVDVGNLTACGNQSFELLDIVFPDNNVIEGIAMNTDGSLLAVVTTSTIYVFDAVNGDRRWVAPITSHMSDVRSVRFVAGDSRLVVSGFFGTAIFDAANGQLIQQIDDDGDQFITSNGQSVYVLSHSDRRRTFIEFDANTGAPKRVFPSNLSDMNGMFIGLQGDDRAVLQQISPSAFITMNLVTGEIERTYRFDSTLTSATKPAILSPSGKIAMLLGRGSGLSTRDTMTAIDLVSEKMIAHIPNSVFAVSPDDTQLIARSGHVFNDGPAFVYDLQTMGLRRRLAWTSPDFDIRPSIITFSGDGSRVAGVSLGSLDGRLTNICVRVYTLK